MGTFHSFVSICFHLLHFHLLWWQKSPFYLPILHTGCSLAALFSLVSECCRKTLLVTHAQTKCTTLYSTHGLHAWILFYILVATHVLLTSFRQFRWTPRSCVNERQSIISVWGTEIFRTKQFGPFCLLYTSDLTLYNATLLRIPHQ